MGWLFRGCGLAVFVLGVLFVLIVLGALGVIPVPMKGVTVTFCIIAGFVFVVPLIALWVISKFLKKLGKELGESLQGLASPGASSVPAEIHLGTLDPDDWAKPSEVTRIQSQFASLGFSVIGDFSIEEMPSVKMHAMMKQSESLWAVVYEMTGIGVTTDIVASYADGGSTTWTNAKQVGMLEPRPGHEKVKEAGADAVRLYELVKSSDNKKPRKPVSAATFTENFEKAHREEMAWRMSRGGTTREEIKRIAIAGGHDVSDEQISQVEEISKAENRGKLEGVFRKNFLESNQITAAQWDAVGDRVVFVHEQLSVDEALELLGGNAPEGTTSVREAFAVVNNALPEGERFEMLGHIEEPTPCDVYAMPE